jgi:type VI secretion system protein
MGGRGLLSRIGGQLQAADEIRSIVAHLRALLNSRRGQAPSAPAHGVLDFSDAVHGPHGGAHLIAASMRATIAENEPRLRGVTVRHLPEDGELVLRFEIVAQHAAPSGRTVRFATTVRPGGHVDVVE